MKINRIDNTLWGRYRRCFPIMLAAMLLLAPCWVAGQEQSVILPLREVSIRMALEAIEKQTDYTIDEQKRILFSASRLKVGEILDRVLVGTGFVWTVAGSQIVIVHGDEAVIRVPEDPHSTMYRNSLPDGMRVVSDHRSSVQISAEENARIHNGFWRNDSTSGRDSIALAILNFRVNSIVLEPDYMDNARTLEVIHRTFSDKELLTAMDFITVTAAASPEGNTMANERLATGRALAAKSYIMEKYPFMNRERIFTFSIDEDWTGLRRMVAEDKNTPYRSQVLHILDSKDNSEGKRRQLRSVGGGAAYRYIADNMLTKLRGAAACMIYYKEDPRTITIVDTVHTETYTHSVDMIYIDRIVERERRDTLAVNTPRKPYYMAVKTNLLYDLALLPDLHVEFSLPRRWSIEVGGQWSWWTSNKSHDNAWRIQTVGAEGRYWLGDRSGKTPLSGHFVGAYLMGGTYDVRLGAKTGYLSNRSYSAGLSYGYSMPLNRSLNLEFGISVGYMGGKYETYHIYDDAKNIFYRDGYHTRHWFGPTKARISLVWLPIGKNPAKTDKRQ